MNSAYRFFDDISKPNLGILNFFQSYCDQIIVDIKLQVQWKSGY